MVQGGKRCAEKEGGATVLALPYRVKLNENSGYSVSGIGQHYICFIQIRGLLNEDGI